MMAWLLRLPLTPGMLKPPIDSAVQIVAAIDIFFFEPPRPHLIAAAGADGVAVIEALMDRGCAAELVGLVFAGWTSRPRRQGTIAPAPDCRHESAVDSEACAADQR